MSPVGYHPSSSDAACDRGYPSIRTPHRPAHENLSVVGKLDLAAGQNFSDRAFADAKGMIQAISEVVSVRP